jgi:glucose-6-phosphate 1-dehydrogenase
MPRDGNAEEAKEAPLSLIVLGASGNLAQTKIVPALFALYCQDFLPKQFNVIGFARRPMTDEEFRATTDERLSCRYAPGESCAEKRREFLSRCSYAPGDYASPDAYLRLYQSLREREGHAPANRVFYMAIPPFLFLDVARAIGGAGLVACDPNAPFWSRAVIEKPFGEDRASSDELVRSMGLIFAERETYRIDHYLGKELVQNLLALRFANSIFEPIWNREHIAEVRISFRENFGVGDRGGYFDKYGIIRDVMQNHLLQMLALVAMEPPARLTPTLIRDEKAKLLRAAPPLTVDDVTLGQYTSGEVNGTPMPAYVDEPSVANDSITPTYAAARLRIDNPRWEGVPFVLSAGKGLDTRKTEIRVRFRQPMESIFCDDESCPPSNELVVRVQPDEAIYIRINNKRPGMGMRLVQSDLDLRYAATYEGPMPEAYESLLLDVIRGDKSLFIRADELEAAWDVFTPVLREIDRRPIRPTLYPFGSAGPA